MTNTDVKVEKYNEWEDMVKAEDRDALILYSNLICMTLNARLGVTCAIIQA